MLQYSIKMDNHREDTKRNLTFAVRIPPNILKHVLNIVPISLPAHVECAASLVAGMRPDQLIGEGEAQLDAVLAVPGPCQVFSGSAISQLHLTILNPV
jgi:hypothetical protein